LKLVVCIPAKDEELTIAKTIVGVKPYSDAILVCDDGSKDATGSIARSQGVKVLVHDHNMGKGEALRTLFEEALKMEPDVVVTLDGDAQHHPEDIPRLVEPIAEGKADMVLGERANESALRRLGHWVAVRLNDSPVKDPHSGFRAYSTRTLPALLPTESRTSVDGEIYERAKDLGLKIATVPISVSPEVNPKNRGVTQAADVLTFSIKHLALKRPLSVFGIPGLVFLGFSAYYALRAYSRMAGGAAQFPTILLDSQISSYFAELGLAFLSTAIILFAVLGAIGRLRR
jgi:glycosyltransferase involved in cell wall biosynthesis